MIEIEDIKDYIKSLILLILLMFGGCKETMIEKQDIKTETKIEFINNEALELLKNKKIFFGHMSVGYNIIDGIIDIKSNHAPLSDIYIEESTAPNDLIKSGFYHAKNGKNGFPKSKVDAFKKFLRDNQNGKKFDIAFFKFCYVDFNRDSNVQEIFDYYVRSIGEIKKDFPHLIIVHVTAPLMSHSWGVKEFLKNLLKGDLANVKRNQFNALLMNKYKNIDPIYDLAGIESIHSDGTKSSFSYKGKEYLSLAKEYTGDGGHLNRQGRYVAAAELLKILSMI